MMPSQERNHYVIEHILRLMEQRQQGCAEPEPDRPESVEAEGQGLMTIHELMRFLDEMPGGFLIYYAGGGEEIIYVNHAVLRLFQCDSIEEFRALTGNSFRGLVHPEDVDAVERSIRSQIAESQFDLDYVEYRIVRKDGAVRWIEDYGHFVQRESHRDIFYVFLGDATEKHGQQLAEKEKLLSAKREKEERLQTLMEEYSRERSQTDREQLRRLEVIEGLSVNYESIFFADLEEEQIQVYRMSPRSEMIFDERFQTRKFTCVITDYCNTWVHPEDKEQFSTALALDHIRKRLAENESYYINYRVLSGTSVEYLQLRLVKVGHEQNTSQIVIGCRSVEEELRQELEQKQILAEALSKATQAASARNVFLSNMSHDMRTPLNAIFGYSLLARRDCRNPEAVERYLDRIDAVGHQLLDLIDKVLELSQTESGENRAVEVECDLQETVGEVCSFLQPQAEEKHIDFSMDCGGVTHKDVYVDAEKLRQLMMYLVNNAVTYTKPGGRVSIRIQEGEGLFNQYADYQFTVEDTGIGISKEFLAEIFKPFTREKNTTLSGIHGIGLGLTIAKSLVDLMGGTIDVDSEVGRGSTFTVTLRCRIQAKAPPEQMEQVISDAEKGGRKILLVEDNEINLEIETEILEELGFQVQTAENGKIAVETLSRAAHGEYDLVLMDIQMPVMGGHEATQEIRGLENRELASIPILAMTANAFEEDKQAALRSGMNGHVAKPIDIDVLMQTLDEILN